MCKCPLVPEATLRPAPRPSRKRVRFASDDDDSENDCPAPSPKLRRVVVLLPLSSEISAEEKNERWFTAQEKNQHRADAGLEARQLRWDDARKLLSGQGHFCFSETYTNVYAVCHLENVVSSTTEEQQDAKQDDKEQEHFSNTVLSPEVVTFLAVSATRGLEDRMVPRVALQRRLARQDIIRSVLSRQDCAESLGDFCSSMTLPARRFAQVLGAADATAAVLEYNHCHQASTIEEEAPLTSLPEPAGTRATAAPAALAAVCA